jgi:hypothetical protein
MPALAPGRAGVQRGQHDQCQQCRGDQSADHDGCDRPLHFGAGPGGKRHRREAERGHQRVIATGRSRVTAPRAIASAFDDPLAINCLIEVGITSPLSTATPHSAMKPTAAETENGMRLG